MTRADKAKETLGELKDTLAAIKRLLKNEDFQAIMVPHFQTKAAEHIAGCRDKTLTPEKRAEHIEAAELAENLTTYLETRERTVAKLIEQREK